MILLKSSDGGKRLFAECPDSHPFAFKYGKMCCDSLTKGKNETIHLIVNENHAPILLKSLLSAY